jgi:hypothetical protein
VATIHLSLLLQAINGYLSITAICATFIFARYIYINCEQGYKVLRPAIALMVLWFGDFILRGPIFIARILENSGLTITFPLWALLLGSMIVELGMLCCIRVFSPETWKFWSWLGTLLVASFLVGCSFVLVLWGLQ